MKNLKKVLALGLALIMLLGMFTVVSAAEDKKTASDLTDWNTVQHQDAVSLMVDLGIIKGMPDGSFQPEGNIDRASWAKMVYYAATGSEDADAYLGTASGLGDIAGNWAESYISYLKANNYISGDNYGNYNPSNNVTVAEACKMMLTVLGYDATDRAYQNNSAWAGNIMTDAKRNGLMDNVDKSQTALVPLTRENAAEIVLNALNANMVEGIPQWDNGNRYITTYSKLAPLGYDVFNLVKLTATVDGIDENGYATFSAVTDPTGGDKYKTSIGHKVKATASMVGEDVNVYIKGDGFKWNDEKTGEMTTLGDFVNVISTSAAKTASTPVKVITGGAKWSELTTRGSSNFVATEFAKDKDGNVTTAYYLNGNVCADEDTEPYTGIGSVKAALGLRGSVVEFYTDDDGAISSVKAYKYSVGQLTGDVRTKTLSDGTVQVTVPGITGMSNIDSDKITGWQGLAEDDVILYYKTQLDNNTYSWTLVEADKVTGKVSSFSTDGVLFINGSKYRGSEQNGAGTVGDVTFSASNDNPLYSDTVFGAWTAASKYNLVDEYDFYLDKNGSIVAGVQLTESLDASKVCLVIETEVTDGGLGTSGSLAANLLFVDGSTEIVKVSKVADPNDGYTLKTVVDTVKDASKQIASDKAQEAIAGKKDANALKLFFNYKSTSSGYELTALNATTDARNWENPVATQVYAKGAQPQVWKESTFAKIPNTKDSKDIYTWPGTQGNITADATTTFVVGKVNANDDSVVYSIYKGFKNVPTMDVARMTAICANTTTDTSKVNTVAKYVYLETGIFKDDVPTGYIFILNNNASIDSELAEDDVYVIDIIDTDGTKGTMRITGDLKDDIVGESMKWNATDRVYVGNFWSVVEMDENGVVSVLGDEDKDDQSGHGVYVANLKAIGNEVVTTAAGSWDYDSETVFVYVDMGWADSKTSDNTINKLDPTLDDIAFADAGTFRPDNFFDENDVGDNTHTYKSVEAAVVVPDGSTTADYVYVVRYLW